MKHCVMCIITYGYKNKPCALVVTMCDVEPIAHGLKFLTVCNALVTVKIGEPCVIVDGTTNPLIDWYKCKPYPLSICTHIPTRPHAATKLSITKPYPLSLDLTHLPHLIDLVATVGGRVRGGLGPILGPGQREVGVGEDLVQCDVRIRECSPSSPVAPVPSRQLCCRLVG